MHIELIWLKIGKRRGLLYFCKMIYFYWMIIKVWDCL